MKTPLLLIQREYNHLERLAFPEKVQRRQKQWRMAHPKQCKIIMKRWMKNHPGRKQQQDAIRNRKRKYGISEQEYQKLLKSQKSKCAICSSSLKIQQPALDHCHKTHKIRGILCHPCNLGIGFLKDNILLLKSALKYLQSS